MHELNHDAAGHPRDRWSGKPAANTRRSRFVALITPLTDSGVESAALAAVVDAAPTRAQILGEQNVDAVHAPGQVEAELDITPPSQG